MHDRTAKAFEEHQRWLDQGGDRAIEAVRTANLAEQVDRQVRLAEVAGRREGQVDALVEALTTPGPVQLWAERWAAERGYRVERPGGPGEVVVTGPHPKNGPAGNAAAGEGARPDPRAGDGA